MTAQASVRVLENGNLCLNIPLAFKHKSGRRMIIAPMTLDGKNPEAESPVQHSLVLALARAHSWMESLENGEAPNLYHLVEKLNLDFSYVCQILHLVNLAPDIQEAIIKGNEPDGMSLTQLRNALPWDWNEQRQLFGVSANV